MTRQHPSLLKLCCEAFVLLYPLLLLAFFLFFAPR